MSARTAVVARWARAPWWAQALLVWAVSRVWAWAVFTTVGRQQGPGLLHFGKTAAEQLLSSRPQEGAPGAADELGPDAVPFPFDEPVADASTLDAATELRVTAELAPTEA